MAQQQQIAQIAGGHAPPRRKRHPLAKIKGGWTSEEDAELIRLVHELGEGNWSPIARALNTAVGKDETNGRIGKQCRERWNHHLRPDIRKDAWGHDEEELLVKAHKALGNRWSDIARTISGRSENAVKNHWNATLRRRDLPDPDPGPLKIYMQGLNLSKPQSRPRCAFQQQHQQTELQRSAGGVCSGSAAAALSAGTAGSRGAQGRSVKGGKSRKRQRPTTTSEEEDGEDSSDVDDSVEEQQEVDEEQEHDAALRQRASGLSSSDVHKSTWDIREPAMAASKPAQALAPARQQQASLPTVLEHPASAVTVANALAERGDEEGCGGQGLAAAGALARHMAGGGSVPVGSSQEPRAESAPTPEGGHLLHDLAALPAEGPLLLVAARWDQLPGRVGGVDSAPESAWHRRQGVPAYHSTALDELGVLGLVVGTTPMPLDFAEGAPDWGTQQQQPESLDSVTHYGAGMGLLPGQEQVQRDGLGCAENKDLPAETIGHACAAAAPGLPHMGSSQCVLIHAPVPLLSSATSSCSSQPHLATYVSVAASANNLAAMAVSHAHPGQAAPHNPSRSSSAHAVPPPTDVAPGAVPTSGTAPGVSTPAGGSGESRASCWPMAPHDVVHLQSNGVVPGGAGHVLLEHRDLRLCGRGSAPGGPLAGPVLPLMDLAPVEHHLREPASAPPGAAGATTMHAWPAHCSVGAGAAVAPAGAWADRGGAGVLPSPGLQQPTSCPSIIYCAPGPLEDDEAPQLIDVFEHPGLAVRASLASPPCGPGSAQLDTQGASQGGGVAAPGAAVLVLCEPTHEAPACLGASTCTDPGASPAWGQHVGTRTLLGVGLAPPLALGTPCRPLPAHAARAPLFPRSASNSSLLSCHTAGGATQSSPAGCTRNALPSTPSAPVPPPGWAHDLHTGLPLHNPHTPTTEMAPDMTRRPWLAPGLAAAPYPHPWPLPVPAACAPSCVLNPATTVSTVFGCGKGGAEDMDLVRVFQDPPSCTLVITTLALPPMEHLVNAYMPQLTPPASLRQHGSTVHAGAHHALAGQGQPATTGSSFLEQASAQPTSGGSSSGIGMPPGAPVTQMLGSKGPIRVCLPELASAMLRARLPLTRLPSGAGPDESTECLVADFSHMLRLVCRRALLAQQQQDGTPSLRAPGEEHACVLAVRLGCDTPSHEYSVLVAIRGRTEEGVAASVKHVSQSIAPLLC